MNTYICWCYGHEPEAFEADSKEHAVSVYVEDNDISSDDPIHCMAAMSMTCFRRELKYVEVTP